MKINTVLPDKNTGAVPKRQIKRNALCAGCLLFVYLSLL